MADLTPEVLALKDSAKQAFHGKFGYDATIAAYASGRVNLIGEHVDYADGLVFPFSIHLGTVVVGKAREDAGSACRVLSLNMKENPYQEFDFSTEGPTEAKWSDYVKGVLHFFHKDRTPVPSLDICVISNVPLGGGLSSSASLEVALATFLEELCQKPFQTGAEKALLCQKAEHVFPKMPCGIMDQFIAVHGKVNHACLIDCRTNTSTAIHMGEGAVEFVVTNSNVVHKLANPDGEYAKRKKSCSESLKILQSTNPSLTSLRDVTPEMIQSAITANPDSLDLKRGYHVVHEIQRVKDAVDALAKQDYSRLGTLMYQSHESLRDLFEVSCKELDVLVEIARGCEGVYGSRMTGGGFGGCTITLVQKGKGKEFMEKVLAEYKSKTGIDAVAFITSASTGTCVLPL